MEIARTSRHPTVGRSSISSVSWDNLRARNAVVEPVGAVTQPFLSVSGQEIKGDGEDVQVFEYPDAESAAREARTVSLDLASVGTMVTWIAPPSFYVHERLIVITTSQDDAVLCWLDAVLDRPFAGVGARVPADLPQVAFDFTVNGLQTWEET